MYAPFDWYSGGRGLERFGHAIISTAILSLPLIQAGQLTLTGERKATLYWLTCGYVN